MTTGHRTEEQLLGEVTALRERVANLETEVADLERARESEREQRVFNEALRDVAAALNSTLDFDEVLNLILTDVERVVPYDAVEVFLVEGEYARLAGSRNNPQGRLGDDVADRRFLIADFHDMREMSQTGQPIAIPDTRNEPKWVDVPGSTWIRSFAGAPIRKEAQTIGFLAVLSITRNFFTPTHARRLQAFADQAAVAIDNSRLYEEVQQAVDNLAALNDVARVTSSTLEFETLLGWMAEAVTEALKATRSVILLRTADEHILKIAGGYDTRPDTAGQDIGVEISQAEFPQLWEVLESLETTSVIDVLRTIEAGAVRNRLRRYEINTTLLVPIIIGDEEFAVMSVGCSDNRRFDDRQIQLAEAIASHVAVAIQNAQLFGEVHKNAEQLESLRQMTLDITARLDRNAVLHTLVEKSMEFLGAQGGEIWLVRPDGEAIEAIVALGLGKVPKGMRLERGEGVVGRVWETGESLKVDDYPGWEGALSMFRDFDPMTTLGIPVQWGDEFLGVFIATADSAHAFTERDEHLLSLFASQAAVAIRNARLYQQVQRQAVQLDALRHITLDITAELDLNRLLETLLENACRLLDVEAGGIYFYLPDRDVLEWSVFVGEGHAPLGAVLHRGEGLSGKVWERGVPMRVQHYAEWEGRAQIFDGYEWTGVLAVPIQLDDEFLGVFDVLTEAQHRGFTDNDVHLLGLLADQAAVAIKNAKHFESIQKRAAKLDTRVQKRTAELFRVRQRAEAVLRWVGEPVALIDAEGYIMDANPAFEAQIGPTTIAGDRAHASTFLAEGWLPTRLFLEAQAALRTSDVWRGEVVIARPDGSPYEAAVTVTPLRDESGEPESYVASLRDISALKEVERLKQEFMRLVRHEMRTPLTSMQGFSSMLLDGDAGELPERANRYVKSIKRNAIRLASIVEAIIDAMRIYAGELTLDIRDVDLSKVVDTVVEDARLHIRDNQKSITINVPDNLPPVSADKLRLRQVLQNLVENAVKFGGKDCQIDVDATYVDSPEMVPASADGFVELPCVLVSVSDNGQGISKADQQKLYEPFVRVGDPSVRAKSGSGLGLYIVHALVDMHGGTTWLESELGEGSTFYVAWPVASDGILPTRDKATAISYTSPRPIMVASADAALQQVVQNRLEAGGFEVCQVSNSEEAMAAMLEQRPGLVVADGRLGHVEGRTVFDRLAAAADGLDIPLVAFLSEGAEDGQRRYRVSEPFRRSVTLDVALEQIGRIAEKTSARRKRLLVIDDEPETSGLIRDSLGMRQVIVQVARTGEQARELVREARPDLIVLDMMLPDVDGYELLSEFKGDVALDQMPILVIIANENEIPQARAKAYALGADGFIVKPFSVNDMVGEIDLLLYRQDAV